MTKNVVKIALVLLFLGACQSSSKKIGNIEAKQTDLRSYEIVKESSGLTLILIPDQGLPYFSMNLMLDTGSSEDPKGKKGLTQFMASSLTKGSNKHSSLEIADGLAQIGSDFGASVTEDYTVLSASTISQHSDELIDWFSEIILEPKFDKSEIVREKEQILAVLKRRYDSPSVLASTAFQRYLYADHPYNFPIEGLEEDVKSISRKDLIRRYLEVVRPNRGILTVVGTFTESTIQKIRDNLKSWEPRTIEKVKEKSFHSGNDLEVLIVDKSDLVQAEIRMGHEGISRGDSRYLTSRIANSVIGSGFTSRLMDHIRDNLGLTYGISSYFSTKLQTGTFQISAQTKVSNVGKLISETLNVLEKLKKEGANSEEVARGKASALSQYVSALETAESLGFNLAYLKIHGVSEDYLKKFISHLSEINKSKVNKIYEELLHPERMKILIVGPANKIKGQLKNFSKIKVLDYKKSL